MELAKLWILYLQNNRLSNFGNYRPHAVESQNKSQFKIFWPLGSCRPTKLTHTLELGIHGYSRKVLVLVKIWQHLEILIKQGQKTMWMN